MQLRWIPTAALLLPLAVFAAEEKAGAKKEKPRLSPEIEKMVDLARSTPPEFAADALLRIATSGRIPQKELRIELIEEAFQIAGGAQQPLSMTGIAAIPVDTTARYRSAAFQLKLDALSLQARAVRTMMQTDARLGRQLFTRIIKPALPARTCSDPLVFDASAFYDALGDILRQGLTEAERRREEQVVMLTTAISSITSHVELAPAARLISTLGLRRDQLELVLSAFAQKLASISGDDRSFTVAAQELRGAFSELNSLARSTNIETSPFLESVRKYLVRQLSGPRCGDNLQLEARSGQVVHLPAWFNAEFQGQVAPITEEDLKASTETGEVKFEPYFHSAAARQIVQETMRLRLNDQGSPLGPTARATTEWKTQFSEVLAKIGNWSANQEASDSDYFHQKIVVLESLLELAPPGRDRDRILEAYVAFLAGSNLQRSSWIEWFWHAKSMLQRMQFTAFGEPGKVLAAFRGSGNSVLVLTSVLEEEFPQSPFFPK